MSSFVLVHGSWHGAWCWYKVLPRLRAQGHEAVAVELPGHGRDRTPLAQINLDSYANRIVEAVDAAREPVVLVGHSRGGIAITQAAERRPERIRTLVYLAAYLLGDGQTVVDVAPLDEHSLVLASLDVDPDLQWDMLRAHAFEPALYADCSPDDVALAHSLLAPEPLVPSLTQIKTTPARFGSVPRAYIELLDDRAVTPQLQRRMQTAVPCDRVISMRASHSAYFSRPDELAGQLDALASDPQLEAPTCPRLTQSAEPPPVGAA